ncbi:MAG: hypothetical protein KDI27_10800 [Gammaproteobacteria bacterium]|nr:hypothetical protein [Gammaproteobacteria bacterium]MCP5415739.1 hypothetical protein [Chromatiaceae bacterium]
MRVKPFFPVFIVLIGVVVYAYYAPENRPEKGITSTPREYIELVEKSKAERRQQEESASKTRPAQ